MLLRWYQSEAVEAVYRYLREKSGNPCVVLPTGAGKTPVLATICRDAVVNWDGRVLVLAHVKELLEQSAAKIRDFAPAIQVGVYSAGLKRRDTQHAVIVAGIQSVHEKAEQLGRFDLVIVDEAHLIPASGDGMYRKLIGQLIGINPDLRVIGLTATPYRLGSGTICGKDQILTEICYEAGVKPLIAQGFLSPLVGKAAASSIDTSKLSIVRGEFADDQTEAAFTEDDSVALAATEVVAKTLERRSVLLFCQSVTHARQMAAELRAMLVVRDELAVEQCRLAMEHFHFTGDPLPCPDLPVWADWLEENGHPVELIRDYLALGKSVVGEIYGDTHPDERAELIAKFKSGELRYLVNVNVLTTGFDAPNVDCVCLLRATVSPGLYYQMVGRGFRLYEGKRNCLVLDFGENIVRHGPVDCIKSSGKAKAANPAAGDRPGKVCPECGEVVSSGVSACTGEGCNYVWPVAIRPSHNRTASDADPVSGPPKDERRAVLKTTYKVHTKKGGDENTPKTLRVTYQLGPMEWQSEWVCVEHQPGSYAHRRAKDWWKLRCRFPMPSTAVEAVQVADHGLFAEAESITVRTDAKKEFPEIVGVELGDIPERDTPCLSCGAHNMRCIQRYDDVRHPGKIVCGECGEVHGYADAKTCEVYGFLGDPTRYQGVGMLPASWFKDAPESESRGDSWEPDEVPDGASEYVIPDDIPF